MGGYFPFFTENRPQKHKKHTILHTLQANGGARAPPPPLATLLSGTHFCIIAPRHQYCAQLSGPRFEPQTPVPETNVLPLDQLDGNYLYL